MPALGMAQETGKLVRWLKSEGDKVSKGEPLMEVETDKAVVEVESPANGVLAGVTAAGGDDIAVGQAIAFILAPGESVPANNKPAVASAPHVGHVPSDNPVAPAPKSPGVQGLPPASPKARRLAAERGVELTKVVGTGPGGAVLEQDILQSGGHVETGLWRAMAENVTRSWRDAPHFFVMREIDASALVDERGRQPQGVTYTDMLVRAVGAALARHPRMNGPSSQVNVGIAVALPDGLIVPVIHGADRLTVAEVAARRQELIERLRAGKVRSTDVTGGTFTISNLGMYGVDVFTAILTEGQAGILAVGRIADRVVAWQGAPAVRPTMQMSLSCDHRRIDGARAAEFVQTLVALLETPQDS